MIEHIRWEKGRLFILDQRRLPEEEVYLECRRAQEVAEAIRSMAVRGAPAIGIVAALGVALESRYDPSRVEEAMETLRRTRPTAQNLFWALERMRQKYERERAGGDIPSALEEEALRIWSEDVEANRRMAEAGSPLIGKGARILTHCNAGALATGGYGTALGLIRRAHEEGKGIRVFATETRPLLQGARLTAWELQREGIPVVLITDGMAGYLMQRGEVDLVIVGADRVARNGDVANKIGTYTLAVLAKEHGIPLYVAAPSSTFDPAIPSGAFIPIEERNGEEVRRVKGVKVAPEGVDVWNPAFDVTPHHLIRAIITEKGVIEGPTEEKLKEVFGW